MQCLFALEDIERLDVGFVNKQEYLEEQYFENKEEMYVWFVLHFKEESEYLTSICNECKSKTTENTENSIIKIRRVLFYSKGNGCPRDYEMDGQKSRRTLGVSSREQDNLSQ